MIKTILEKNKNFKLKVNDWTETHRQNSGSPHSSL